MRGGGDQHGKDPRLEKARDTARQRKINSNQSDKAARRHARNIKAAANRQLRRKARQDLADLTSPEDLSGLDLTVAHRSKARHWGTHNAAEQRQMRDAERAYLDRTPVETSHGRRRAQALRLSHDRSTAELRAIAARFDGIGLPGFAQEAKALRQLADHIDQISRDSTD